MCYIVFVNGRGMKHSLCYIASNAKSGFIRSISLANITLNDLPHYTCSICEDHSGPMDNDYLFVGENELNAPLRDDEPT